MLLSCCLAQNFIDKHLNRPIAVDGSLMGMGRIPGNLPIELIADYANDYIGKIYDLDYLMDAINDYIAPIKGESKWGYTPAYFLSARYNLHRNYSEYYLQKGDLTNREINHILSQFDTNKKTVFNSVYADELYEEYKNNQIDDSMAWVELKSKLREKHVLVLAPGSTINTHKEDIIAFIADYKPIVIGANFIPDGINVDYAFFSNSKRFSKIEEYNCKVIVTSNLMEGNPDYRINYNSVSGAFNQGCNSLIMLLKMLKNLKVAEISMAGADGYKVDGDNYYSDIIKSATVHDNNYNLAVKNAICNLGLNIRYITPSEYNK
jgi:4-hydroxy 2-oxovalerate aldolase